MMRGVLAWLGRIRDEFARSMVLPRHDPAIRQEGYAARFVGRCCPYPHWQPEQRAAWQDGWDSADHMDHAVM